MEAMAICPMKVEGGSTGQIRESDGWDMISSGVGLEAMVAFRVAFYNLGAWLALWPTPSSGGSVMKPGLEHETHSNTSVTYLQVGGRPVRIHPVVGICCHG
jgi:hypothetical protein